MKDIKENRIVFHGTNKKNAEAILENGFEPRTYFVLHLEDALEFGGEYIFSVVLDGGDKNWQPRPDKRIHKNKISRLIKINPRIVYERDVSFCFPETEKYPCPNCNTDIGKVKLSVFEKPINPRCPFCKKTFKELFSNLT